MKNKNDVIGYFIASIGFLVAATLDLTNSKTIFGFCFLAGGLSYLAVGILNLKSNKKEK